MAKTKIGIIGCGNISGIYLKNCQTVFEDITIAAVADMLPERAKAKAEEFKIPKACSVAELLADPEIKIVVNLTIPKAHGEVALAALQAGKSVHNEKPLALTREDGKKLLDLAKAKNLRVGCAPDTFMGGGIQTCRKLIDDGWIGQPVAATAFMTCHGHESWHPDPEFYYKVGGGPMFDMGPYYLTALVALMGPARRVTGSVRTTFATRTITSQPKYGTVITSFDVWAAKLPCIEIYGTTGSLSVPDPNGFGGPVMVRRAGAKDWSEVPLTHAHADNCRGIAVADMAKAIAANRPHRANGELAYHVLDMMHAVHDASKANQHVMLQSTCQQPAPLPMDLRNGQMD